MVLSLLISSIQISNASAFTLGCSKAQKDGANYLSSSLSSLASENNYLKRGMYDAAFSSFQYANKWYASWLGIVNKSPKCFTNAYITRNKSKLKTVSVNQAMHQRYGVAIASRYNYGSPDPCFKFLGDDEAYFNCSVSYATPDYSGYAD